MRKTNEISSAELEVLQVLWELEKPSKIQALCEHMRDGKGNYSTIATLVGRLKEKGAVNAEKRGKTFYYSAALDRDEYVRNQTNRFIKRLYGGSAVKLALSLFRSGDLTKEEMSELRGLLDERGDES